MAPKRQRWPKGFAPLLCLGTVIAIHLPADSNWREPTAWRFTTRLASTMQFALERDTLLVPSGIELLGG